MAESVQEGSGLQQSLALASTASPRWPLARVTQKRPPPPHFAQGEGEAHTTGEWLLPPPKSGGFWTLNPGPFHTVITPSLPTTL